MVVDVDDRSFLVLSFVRRFCFPFSFFPLFLSDSVSTGCWLVGFVVALLFFAGGFSLTFGGLHSLPVGTRVMVAFSRPRSPPPCFSAAPSSACGDSRASSSACGYHAPTTLGARPASFALSLLPLFPGLASMASILPFPLWISSNRHHLALPPSLPVLFWPESP